MSNVYSRSQKHQAALKRRVERNIESVKQAIAKDIAQILIDQQLTQTDAAYIMQDAPSQVSLVVTGKLRGFSIERLFRMRALLGAKVRVVVSSGTAFGEVVYIAQ